MSGPTVTARADAAGGVRVRVARTPEEVAAIGGAPTSTRPSNPDADVDHLLAQVAATPGARPHVIRVDPAGGPPALVVARLARNTYRWKVGYRTLARLSAPTIVVAFDGVLGCTDESGYARVVDVLREQVDSGEAAAVLFPKVEVGSLLWRALDGCATPARLAYGPRAVRHTLTLPESWEALMALRSTKSRKALRYDDTRFHRTFGDRMTLRRYGPDDQDPDLLRDMKLVAAHAYQRGLGVDDLEGPTSSALLALAREKGWLRAWVLYLDDRPVAFWWGTVYAGTLSLGTPGYLPELAKERVGHYTLRRMIEDACADPQIREINFGHGDAEYKERFANAATTTADITLFAPLPRSAGLRTLVALDAATASATDRIAGTDLGQRAKRRLRRQAVNRAAADTSSEATAR
jgi:CelD/BcsL family acetyltransferase involved in cellulose biosynthesis